MGTIRENADRILYDMGLLDRLREIGEPHVTGSYMMDMMAWNDLDIDIENDDMSLDRLHELTGYIIKTFHPVWYEAKEEVTDEGKAVWFQGAEAVIDGELWNLDLWFFDRETIGSAERCCKDIMSRAAEIPGARESIIEIKRELRARGLYGSGGGKYTSMDVYRGVLEQGIMSAGLFLESYRSMEIRQADLKSPELLELFARHDAHMMDFLGEHRKYYTPYSENEHIARAWIVYIDGEPAGCAAYRERPEGVCELKRLFIRPGYRGRGISKGLLETVEGYAREQGCHTIALDTNSALEPAVTIYKRRGFRVVHQEGEYIQMEKTLS